MKMGRMARTVLMALIALLLGGPGFALAQPDPASSAAITNASGYSLGLRDVIEVAVLGRDDYKFQVQVQDDGNVPLPLIGSIPALDKQPLQLKSEIERRLVAGGYFVHPEVVVTLVTASSRYAVLLGEVVNPGLIALDHDYRLSEVLARAGGVKAGSDAVSLTFPNGEAREYSLRAIATNASPDPVVAPGAKILVEPAAMFYIYGQIGTPGGYPAQPDMTVRRALASGGGLTPLGSSGKVKIFRGESVMRKVDPDTKVLPGDTIFVGEKFF